MVAALSKAFEAGIIEEEDVPEDLPHTTIAFATVSRHNAKVG